MALDFHILFFRVAAAVAVAGMSFLPFMIPSVVRLVSEQLFSLLNHFGAGVFLGLSIVCFPIEAVKDLNDNFPLVAMIGSVSFISMISIEQFAVCSGGSMLASYSYATVNVDDEDDPDVEMARPMNASTGTNTSGVVDVESSRVGGTALMNKRFFPSSILGVTSIYAIMNGLDMGSKLHYGYGTLERLLVNHFLISLTLGSVLEFMHAPRSYFSWFAIVFSLSSPLGILSSGFVSVSGDAVNVIDNVTGICNAVAAGVFLYLASSHILPAEMLYLERRYSDAQSTAMKVCAMFAGFAITALPSVLLKYE
jgi:hypothetical protein